MFVCMYILRSAYLSLLNGFCYMAVLGMLAAGEVPRIFSDTEPNTYAIFAVCMYVTQLGQKKNVVHVLLQTNNGVVEAMCLVCQLDAHQLDSVYNLR